MEKKHKEAKKPNIEGLHFMLKGWVLYLILNVL
jgi:hypothetical protein